MYDPDNMPTSLLNIHKKIDNFVDDIYQKKGFKNDNERIKKLFDLYEEINNSKILI